LTKSGRDAPVGYFCISAVSTYHGDEEYSDLEDLKLVPREARTMREALAGLGLIELFPATDGEMTHEQLREKLARWAHEYDPEDPPALESTLVIYSTGHGRINNTYGWQLVPPEPRVEQEDNWTVPTKLVTPVLSRKDVKQIILILDACFAADGAREALTKSLGVAPILGSTADLWVIASARRSEKAQQMIFAPAMAEALRRCAARELSESHLDPSLVTDTAASMLKRNGIPQVPWVAAGYRAGGCQALPNPRFMPPAAPDWIERRWSAPARGVSMPDEAGWFFNGRDDVLRGLAGYLVGESGPDSRPILLTGAAGTGKTAVLGRLLTTVSASLRRRLPPVARRGYMPSGDAEITALDVLGVDVGHAAMELARRLGLPAVGATHLAAALAGRPGPHCLIIDHVDRATNPAAMVSQLVQPLSDVVSVRLVVAARPGLAAAFLGFQPVDLHGADDDVQSAIEAYIRERLIYYLGSQSESRAHELTRTVEILASACVGNYAATVAAVDTLLRQLEAGLPMKKAAEDAQEAAYRRLDRLCRSVMTDARVGSASRYVDDLVACLSAACSYSPDGWLPGSRWAGLARRVNGLSYTAEDAEACAEHALVFLRCGSAPDGGLVWRPRYGYVPSGNDPARQQVVEHLLAEVRQENGPHWHDEHPGVLAVLLGAAAEHDRFDSLLDDAELLLAAPAPLVTRAFKASHGRTDGRRRMATWASVPVRGKAHDRAFLLRLCAARNGLDRLTFGLSNQGRDASPSVVWAIRTSSARRHSPVTRLALAAGPGTLRIVTGHDNGSVTWWDGSNGRELRTWPGLPDENLSVVSVTASLTTEGLVTAVATGDRRVLSWGPHDTAPHRLAGSATLVTVHASGLAALVNGHSISIVDMISGAPDRGCVLPSEVATADIAGTAEAPVLWLADSRGRVWRWDLLDPRSRRPSLTGPGRPTLLIGCSREGDSAVVVDLHGGMTFPARPRAAVRRKSTPDVHSVALSETWLVLAGGTARPRPSNWLEVHDAAGTGDARWPLDGMPVGVGISGDILVAATPDGLASICLAPADIIRSSKLSEAGGTR